MKSLSPDGSVELFVGTETIQLRESFSFAGLAVSFDFAGDGVALLVSVLLLQALNTSADAIVNKIALFNLFNQTTSLGYTYYELSLSKHV